MNRLGCGGMERALLGAIRLGGRWIEQAFRINSGGLGFSLTVLSKNGGKGEEQALLSALTVGNERKLYCQLLESE